HFNKFNKNDTFTRQQQIQFKSRSIGGLDKLESGHLMRYANDLLGLLQDGQDPIEKDIKKWRNDLSGILFQYSKRKEDTNLEKLFKHMLSRREANEASYTIMMRHYSNLEDFEKVKSYFEHMKENDIIYHGRTFIPLITLCLKLERYKKAERYFDLLLQSSRSKFIHNAFVDLIRSCGEIRTDLNEQHLEKMVNSSLKTLEKFGCEPIGQADAESLEKWFKSTTKIKWRLTEVDVANDSRKCPCCNAHFKKNTISQKRMVRLKRNMMAYVESNIALKANSKIADVDRKRRNKKIREVIQRQADHYGFYDTLISGSKDDFRELSSTKKSTQNDIYNVLGKLENYLDSNGPFDVVMDASNIGYYTKGFNPLQVRDVADEFKDQKCLILCAGILKEKLLTQNPVPNANVRLKNLLLYLQKNHHIFFVGSSVLDDYYILYTILYHNFDIGFVSRDLLRDHLYHLDSTSRVDFQRWQAANQYILQSFTDDNKPVFSGRLETKISVQSSPTGWHIPKSTSNWICVQEE
uniref:ribonuclease P n=2 Tax=Clytia hemisphaerica TaxID=252671 RepID=A0A7M5WQ35_9CNID